MTRLRSARWLAAGLGLAGSTLAAFAQTPVQPQPRDPNMPSPQATPPEKIESGSSPSLSEKLEQTGGVIRPPADIDPGITTRAPVPEPNSTPVIPPPGTTGGNPAVVPK